MGWNRKMGKFKDMCDLTSYNDQVTISNSTQHNWSKYTRVSSIQWLVANNLVQSNRRAQITDEMLILTMLETCQNTQLAAYMTVQPQASKSAHAEVCISCASPPWERDGTMMRDGTRESQWRLCEMAEILVYQLYRKLCPLPQRTPNAHEENSQF